MKHICKALVMLMVFASVIAAQAQPRSELPLYKQLTSTNENMSVAGLNKVLSESERCSAVALFMASGVAFREKRIEDAGYLFYVAKLRANFDLTVFPPTATNAASPVVAFNALNEQLGNSINPAVMADPKAFAKIIERVKKWNPVLTANYDPGWTFAKKADEKQARAALQADTKKFMDIMGPLSILLQDNRYFSAFKVMQNYNLSVGHPPPSKAAYDNAVQTILQIEKAKGVQVLTLAIQRQQQQ